MYALSTCLIYVTRSGYSTRNDNPVIKLGSSLQVWGILIGFFQSRWTELLLQTFRADHYPISPYKINTVSSSLVMRIAKIIILLALLTTQGCCQIRTHWIRNQYLEDQTLTATWFVDAVPVKTRLRAIRAQAAACFMSWIEHSVLNITH